MHCYRSYVPRRTLRGAIVAGLMPRKVAGKKIFFPSNSVRLLKGISKEDEKISVDDIVSFLKLISVYQVLSRTTR
jgi:hypothetical protein